MKCGIKRAPYGALEENSFSVDDLQDVITEEFPSLLNALSGVTTFIYSDFLLGAIIIARKELKLYFLRFFQKILFEILFSVTPLADTGVIPVIKFFSFRLLLTVTALRIHVIICLRVYSIKRYLIHPRCLFSLVLASRHEHKRLDSMKGVEERAAGKIPCSSSEHHHDSFTVLDSAPQGK